ncbi:MAG: hypothetical protein OEZ47_12220 [Gammaproteobacteria bacterium]|nr:hypothetical protein [Gammaproteobacteria bacterium]
MRLSRFGVLIAFVVLSLMLLSFPTFANESSDVLKGFNEAAAASSIESFDVIKKQHKILFYMGIALLVLIFITASLGVSMAFFAKQVFVHHMIFAGMTVFLSIAHAVVAVVWFNPFR